MMNTRITKMTPKMIRIVVGSITANNARIVLGLSKVGSPLNCNFCFGTQSPGKSGSLSC